MSLVTLVSTVPGRGESSPSLRGDAIARRISTLDPSDHRVQKKLSTLTMAFVDSLVVADGVALETAAAILRERVAEWDAVLTVEAAEVRGWCLALLSVSRWGLERLPSPGEVALRADSQAVRFLRALDGGQTRSSSELRDLVGTGDSQLSRIGRELMNHGLVVQRRAGRRALWELTPRGRQVICAQAESAERTPTPAAPATPARARGARGKASGSANSHSPTGARLARERTLSATPVAAAMLQAPPAGGRRSSRATNEERVVRPHPSGGWMIAKTFDGHVIERLPTRQAALDRGKEILRRTGGILHVYAADGTFSRDVSVQRAL